VRSATQEEQVGLRDSAGRSVSESDHGSLASVVLVTAGLTDVGRERQRNEDAYLVATFRRSMTIEATNLSDAHPLVTGGAEGTLLIVADGMGGQGGGDVASRIAVQTIASYVLDVLPWFSTRPPSTPVVGRETEDTMPNVRGALSDAVAIGDSTVRFEAERGGAETSRMGTTVTIAYVVWPFAYVAHVGDSRCYVQRGDTLTLLTHDHTVAQQMLDLGYGDFDPVMHHLLWNSLGAGEVARPQIVKVRLEPADTLVLCTDGLTKHVSDDEIRQEVGTRDAVGAVCRRLVDRALAAGGSDNVTIVMAHVTMPTP
jgi:serine/threonine protein phosphatase PrpC